MMHTVRLRLGGLAKNQSFALFYHTVVKADLYPRVGRSRLETSPCLVRGGPGRTPLTMWLDRRIGRASCAVRSLLSSLFELRQDQPRLHACTPRFAARSFAAKNRTKALSTPSSFVRAPGPLVRAQVAGPART